MPAQLINLTDHKSRRPASMGELIAMARDVACDPGIPEKDHDYRAGVLMRLERSTYLARLCGAATELLEQNPVAEVIEMSQYLGN